jgi:hypothetical protein
MANLDTQMTYFENMSRAFAMKAHRVASVMHSDIYNPPAEGIWGRIEWPVLKAGNPGGVVDFVSYLLDIMCCWVR